MLYALSIRPEPFSMASDSMQVFTPEEQKQLPKHIAIIMDGNGRWAKSLGKPRLFGHRNGVKNVRDIVNAARAIGIPYVTLYAFSQENQNRPSEEKSGLMKLLQEFIKIELNGMQRDGIRLRAIGDLRGLPDYARKAVEDAIEKTKTNQSWNLTLALNYSSRQEVLQAVSSYCESQNERNGELTWAGFAEHLETKDLPDPDLIIRTSGEFRLSNFLLLQAAYAEIFVSPLHWPEFDRKAFEDALREYIRRERRFGKTSEQLTTQNSLPHSS